MTSDEFRDRFKVLMEEFDPDHKMDYLLMIVTFDTKNDPDDIHMLGMGCAACIAELLNEQVDNHTIKHINEKHKIH